MKDWKTWWNTPTVMEDRITGLICGAIGGAIIGLVIRVILTETPTPISIYIYSSILGLFVGACMGFVIPKPISLICAPFVKMLDGL